MKPTLYEIKKPTRNQRPPIRLIMSTCPAISSPLPPRQEQFQTTFNNFKLFHHQPTKFHQKTSFQQCVLSSRNMRKGGPIRKVGRVGDDLWGVILINGRKIFHFLPRKEHRWNDENLRKEPSKTSLACHPTPSHLKCKFLRMRLEDILENWENFQGILGGVRSIDTLVASTLSWDGFRKLSYAYFRTFVLLAVL